MASISLPFSIPGGHGKGGLANATEERLALEFDFKESMWGDPLGLLSLLEAFSPEDKKVNIPIHEIESVHLQTWLIRAFVTIQLNNLERVRLSPGTHRGQIKLQIGRKDIETAKRFTAFLSQQISRG